MPNIYIKPNIYIVYSIEEDTPKRKCGTVIYFLHCRNVNKRCLAHGSESDSIARNKIFYNVTQSPQEHHYKYKIKYVRNVLNGGSVATP